ncbi:hypothetical protein BDZ91DRAFT_760328 [Kalaharituber pfeilii]|nr:hypothetical protein BDZ91DRAFT_760328 [Kalaharituber pfeilii]
MYGGRWMLRADGMVTDMGGRWVSTSSIYQAIIAGGSWWVAALAVACSTRASQPASQPANRAVSRLECAAGGPKETKTAPGEGAEGCPSVLSEHDAAVVKR